MGKGWGPGVTCENLYLTLGKALGHVQLARLIFIIGTNSELNFGPILWK